MNRTEQYTSQHRLGRANQPQFLAVTDMRRPHRSRYARRRLREYGVQLAWILGTVVLVSWMILIALTLGH